MIVQPSHPDSKPNKKTNKINWENSPDSEKFEKCVDDLSKFVKDNISPDSELLKYFMFFSDISKKTKYQTKILESSVILEKIKELLLKPNSNQDITMECVKIVLNLSKNRNCQLKMVLETVLSFNDLFQIVLVNWNTNLTFFLLSALSYWTENQELLTEIQKQKNGIPSQIDHNLDEDDPNFLVNQILAKVDISTITRTLVEKILDDLNSNNKKTLLKIIQNWYTFNKDFITKDAIQPMIRCLGNKNNDVVISALKILLFFTRDKTYHSDWIATNTIFRLVRTYKQGIDEMDMVIVKILYDWFDNKSIYDILFDNNVLLILSNYLTNFEVEKNEKYEEVIRNVFEIFKLINKNTDEEGGKSYHNISNPLVEDETTQTWIFKKAYSWAAYSKSEVSILSCWSVLQIMLAKFSTFWLSTDDSVKSIIELVPPFFKNKSLDIIKYSLSIFELILDKKRVYFKETYAQSTNQTFSIKSLVHSIINLVNEYSGNYELLSMSCRIWVSWSDIEKLQPHFLQEPQITVIKVFNDNWLKHNKAYRKEIQALEMRLSNHSSNNNHNNNNTSLVKPLNMIQLSGKKDTNSLGGNSTSNANASGKYKISSNQKSFLMRNEEKDKNQLMNVKKRIEESTVLLKNSWSIISNWSKKVDNWEILTLKGFLDVITEKLNDNDTETWPYVVKCIQGFCQGQTSIDIIWKTYIIGKILTTYKLYKKEDEEHAKGKGVQSFNPEGNNINNIDNPDQQNNQNNADKNKQQLWSTTTNRLEVLQSLKNILESDIKLQRTFIIEKGIEILLNDVSGDPQNGNVNEVMLDQLNEMILRVIYVVSCNINKLFLIYFSNEEDGLNNNDSDYDSANESECKSEDNKLSEASGMNRDQGEMSNKKQRRSGSQVSHSLDTKTKNKKQLSYSSNISWSDNEDSSDIKTSTKGGENNWLKIFTSQLSEKMFMHKLIEVGEFDSNSLATYKELVKILINLCWNRYYLKYFTLPRVFDKVISIIGNIMKKYKEDLTNENNYEILKLVIIFLKFICEDENLIKKFLKEDVISVLISTVTKNEFSKNIKEEEWEQFYYNFSLVLLRWTEFSGHVEKFKLFPDFFATWEKLYDINLMNGKIYIISIIRNIIAEKHDFFNEDELSRFLNKIVSQSNTLIIYEFVELIKNLVHNRSMCKRMENVFKYWINEIKSKTYSSSFKKKMLDWILCLSYENANIRDYAWHDWLSLVKNWDVNINQKTTLLILMNFSSISSNFTYLMQDSDNKDKKVDDGEKKNQIDGMTIKKQDFINVVNHWIDSDRFSQIWIQRLLINITSIEGIDMSIISDKILKVWIEILQKSKTLQDNIVIFALATLVNVSNRNIWKLDQNAEEKPETNVWDGYDEHESESMSNTNAMNATKTKGLKKMRSKSNDNKRANMNKLNKTKPKNEIVIVDYILENIPNIIEIIKNWFEKENLDISSLTIMFSCNILRKIKYSKYYNWEKKISAIVDDYVKTENKLNSDIWTNESGKFLIISLIKYCICLSIESTNKGDISQFKSWIDIVMNIFKDKNGVSWKQFKLTITDIKDNTINYACVENQLNFLNMIVSWSKVKDIKYYFTYSSPVELRNYIGDFFAVFINDYAECWVNLKKSLSVSVQNDEDKKQDSNSNSNNNNNSNNITSTNKSTFEINPSFQNVTINILKWITEYVAEIQIVNESGESKLKAIRKKINSDFYRKISSAFEKIVLSFLVYKPDALNEELKSLLIYVLFLIFSNNLSSGNKANQDQSKDKDSIQLIGQLKQSAEEGNNKSTLIDNLELEKWWMKWFMLSTNSIQNDFFCLKIFTLSIQSENFPNIFYQSTKFIKKLMNYLKSTHSDIKKQILQKESERLLNIISFNQNSHSILYSMGVYNIFKTNLYIKASSQNQTCQKEDFILLVNMILNENNKEFIKDDIKSLLQYIFPSKDLANNFRVQLFDKFMKYTVELSNDKKFHEDYLVIINWWYENWKESFSEMIFLFDKVTRDYQIFQKKFLTEDSIVIKMFYEFLAYDTNFPSKPEELNCYLKILELFCQVGDWSDALEKMVNEMMYYFTREDAKNNLRDINILNAIVNFAFVFFEKYCDKHALGEGNIDSSIATTTNFNNDNNAINNINGNGSKQNRNVANEEKLIEFIQGFHYNQWVDIVISNSITHKEINTIYVLTMLLIQEEFKSILLPLKSLNSLLFKKEFMMSFFKTFFNYNTLDIKEFVFVIHWAIIWSNIDNTKLDYSEDLIITIIDVYDKYLLKKISTPNTNNSGNNASDVWNDIVTSLYFFCDLIKLNDWSTQGWSRVLKFLIKIINNITNWTTEQKEILIRYYQEILLNYRINSNEELIIHMTFFNKIHNDKEISFIENLVFGTWLINTRRDVWLKSLNDFFSTITLISWESFDKKWMINYLKFCKQIFLCITNNNSNNMSNNGISGDNWGEQEKECLNILWNYVNNSTNKYLTQIKQDNDLNKKYEKMKYLLNQN